MTQHAVPPDAHPDKPSGTQSLWAVGGTLFAGVLLTANGLLSVAKGISGIVRDNIYTPLGDYIFKIDVAAWGWIHFILGLVLITVGWGLLKDSGWARATGVALTAFNIIVNFMWLPHMPLWALASIALSTFVLWALCTNRTPPPRTGKDQTDEPTNRRTAVLTRPAARAS